ncbi:MAG: rRNA pseudouridine synthase [Actinobacteria bacterium]|nr:rRNA pseudouridine synthase [Actinomycetota bacterium]
MPRVRIQKALSAAGVMSRRAAEAAISEGRVAVDGTVAVLGDRVDVSSQILTLDGIPVTVDPEVETYLVYKPVGVVSTASDPQGRRTVVDLVGSPRRLYPVGRLDVDSEGLILVTNDGALTNLVTHPLHGVTKTYLARVEGKVSPATLRRLREGVPLEDGPAQPVAIRVVETGRNESLVEVVMGEGRNREVRRMMAVVGHEVSSLVRTAIGPIRDPGLKPGQSRRLRPDETRRLLSETMGPS